MGDLLDTYSRRARLLPGLEIMLPASLLFVVLVTSHPHWWAAAASVIAASGLTYLGTQIVRSLGQSTETDLWDSWGGPPTTSKLRFKGCRNPIAMARLHRRLDALFPDEDVPTAESEAEDSAKADLVYETLVMALIAKTRDVKTFGLIFNENCQYGYRRNLYGCRRYGLMTGWASLTVVVSLLLASWAGAIHPSLFGLAMVGVADVATIVFLWRKVTSEWVQEAARAYASRLLDSVEVLTPPEAK